MNLALSARRRLWADEAAWAVCGTLAIAALTIPLIAQGKLKLAVGAVAGVVCVGAAFLSGNPRRSASGE